MARKRTLKVGDTFLLNGGSIATVISYNDSISIKTNTGFIKHNVCMSNLKGGRIQDLLLKKTIYDVCYYQIKDLKGDNYNSYNCWRHMAQRCYDKEYHKIKPTYKNCEMSKEWLTCSIFAEWYNENYIDGWQIDKDLLEYGNKIYSKELCIFVPPEINMLFHKKINSKDRKLPLGVCYHGKNRFKIKDSEGKIYLFDTLEDAIDMYWLNKFKKMELLIKKYPQFDKILNSYFDNFYQDYSK